MLITWLSSLSERWAGTHVTLPKHAIEIFMPRRLFKRLQVDGYCVDRQSADEFIRSVTHRAGTESHTLTELEDAYWKITCADPQVTHIIVCTSRPTVRGAGWSDGASIHRSLINHERFHAVTMPRSRAWHTIADGLLEAELGEIWSGPREAMLGMTTYASMVSAGTDESWLASTEMLARIAAILHAPESRRAVVARYQLETDPAGLLVLARTVYDRWSSAEGVVGWLDAKAAQ